MESLGYGVRAFPINYRLDRLIIALACLAMVGCAGKPLDVEPLEDGGFALAASGSTLSESIEAIRARAYQEASKYCRRFGRNSDITKEELKTEPDRGSASVYVEFKCSAIPMRR